MTLRFDGELFLAGGGDADDSWRLDERLVKEIGRNATMGYVPVALPPDRYPDCREWITDVFSEHGLSDVEMWTDLEDVDASDLEAVSAVYVGGGNTYRLLNELRRTNTVSLLREFVESGGRLYGGSAGAIVCGQTIDTTPDGNRVGVTDTTGLQLLPETDVWCHYSESESPEVRDHVADTGRTVVAIPERSGVSATARRLQVVGHVPVTVFDGGDETTREPGERFQLEEGSS